MKQVHKYTYARPHHCFKKLLYEVIVGKDTDILNKFGWEGCLPLF